MTVEELRNFLNTLVEDNPESKNQEVRIRCWDKDDLWDEGVCDTAMSAEYHAEEKVLIIEGSII